MKWIENLKIGDKVIQLERSGKRVWKWEATVLYTSSVYVETSVVRDIYNAELAELVKRLSPIHRTYEKTFTKNYFAPDGTINLEPLTT
jgi:hypothetical protein